MMIESKILSSKILLPHTPVAVTTVTGPIKAGMEFDLSDELDKFSGINVIINLRKVTFVNSAAIAALLSASTRIQESGKIFFIANANSEILHLIQVLNLRSAFRFITLPEEEL